MNTMHPVLKLTEKKRRLQALEQELNHSYYLLGKKTMEFVERESQGINALVEEVIQLKQSIAKEEQELSHY